MQVYDGKHMSVYRIPDRQLAAKLVHDWVEHILASKLHLPHEVKELARSRLLARIPELAEELVTRPGGIKTALETAYTDAVTE